MQNDRIEVYSIMGHLALTLILIVAYVILRLYGISDETLKYGVIAAISYFFGTTGQSILKGALKPSQSDIQAKTPVDNSTTVNLVQPTQPQQSPTVGPGGNNTNG